MTKQTFEQFVSEKTQGKPHLEAFDPAKSKREWLEALQAFYATVEKYLADFLKAGTI